MKWERLCALAERLPEVVRSTSYGTPALKVAGKLLARLTEDGSAVVFMLGSIEEQQFLIGTRPAIYFITDHYQGYPAVLARLSTLTIVEARQRLESAWRARAPRALAKRAAQPGAAG